MRGKVGLVIGLAAGYVLGTRAGRERYEQIKDQALKVWNLDPVQQQVEKAKGFAKSSVMALPGAVWDGAMKVTKAVQGKGTPGQKLDSALKASKATTDDVIDAAEESAAAIKKSADAAQKKAEAAQKKADAAGSGA